MGIRLDYFAPQLGFPRLEYPGEQVHLTLGRPRVLEAGAHRLGSRQIISDSPILEPFQSLKASLRTGFAFGPRAHQSVSVKVPPRTCAFRAEFQS
jgi:hypothetical protein